VAALFAVDAKTVIRWIDHGQLPAFRTPGGHRRIHAEDAELLMRRMSTPHN